MFIIAHTNPNQNRSDPTKKKKPSHGAQPLSAQWQSGNNECTFSRNVLCNSYQYQKQKRYESCCAAFPLASIPPLHDDFYWTNDLTLDKIFLEFELVFLSNVFFFHFSHSHFIIRPAHLFTNVWELTRCCDQQANLNVYVLFSIQWCYSERSFQYQTRHPFAKKSFFIAVFTLCRFGNAPKRFPLLSASSFFCFIIQEQKKCILRKILNRWAYLSLYQQNDVSLQYYMFFK